MFSINKLIEKLNLKLRLIYFPLYFKIRKLNTTKICNKCGSKKLISFLSLNYKECTCCHNKIDWHLDKNQKPLR